MKINYQVITKKEDDYTEYPDGIVSFTREGPMKKIIKDAAHLGLGRILETGECNGYIGLPKGHKYYGVAYDDIDVSVHGGLTYAREETIEGEEKWIIGFDTCHFDDTPLTWPRQRVLDEILNLYEQIK